MREPAGLDVDSQYKVTMSGQGFILSQEIVPPRDDESVSSGYNLEQFLVSQIHIRRKMAVSYMNSMPSFNPERIRVKVARLGSHLKELSVEKGSRIWKILDAACVDYRTCDICINGTQAGIETDVHVDNCLITVSPQRTPIVPVSASGAYLQSDRDLYEIGRRQRAVQARPPRGGSVFDSAYRGLASMGLDAVSDGIEAIQTSLGVNNPTKEQLLQRSLRRKREKIRSIKATRHAIRAGKIGIVIMATGALIIFSITLLMNFNHKDVEIDMSGYYITEGRNGN